MGIHWSSVGPDENFAKVMIPKIRGAGESELSFWELHATLPPGVPQGSH